MLHCPSLLISYLYCHFSWRWFANMSFFFNYTGRFIMFSMITNIYNKKTKGPTLMEFFTATEKLKKFFLTTRDVWCVHHGWHGTHQTSLVVKKKLYQFSCGCENSIKVGPLVFLWYMRVGTLIVATIYLQLIQNRYMFRSFTVLHCSHQHCVQPLARAMWKS